MTTIVEKVLFDCDGDLMISDPCYVDSPEEVGDRPGLNKKLENCYGRWQAEIELVDAGDWGIRVAALVLRRLRRIKLEDATQFTPERFSEGVAGHFVETDEHSVAVFQAGVDSGQMSAIPVSCLPTDYDDLLKQYDYNMREHGNPENMLDWGGGVVCSSGFGDGGYPIYVEMGTDGRPGKISVVFIGDDLEEDLDD